MFFQVVETFTSLQSCTPLVPLPVSVRPEAVPRVMLACIEMGKMVLLEIVTVWSDIVAGVWRLIPYGLAVMVESTIVGEAPAPKIQTPQFVLFWIVLFSILGEQLSMYTPPKLLCPA